MILFYLVFEAIKLELFQTKIEFNGTYISSIASDYFPSQPVFTILICIDIAVVRAMLYRNHCQC